MVPPIPVNDASGFSRNSISMMGDADDLLADDTLFEKAKSVTARGKQESQPQEPIEEDPALRNEIEIYIRQVAENECNTIDMSDSPLKSYGAKCVAEMLKVCKQLEEIALSNCEIEDQGAKHLFENLRQHMGVKKLFLDGNMLTDKCLDPLFRLLDESPKM